MKQSAIILSIILLLSACTTDRTTPCKDKRGCTTAEIYERIDTLDYSNTTEILVEKNITYDNSSSYLYLTVANISSERYISSDITIDCSLPEETDYTIDIIAGEPIFNNSNMVTITFQELCEKLLKR